MPQLSVRSLGWPLRLLFAVLCLHATTHWSLGEHRLIDKEVIDKWEAYERFARSLQGTARKTTTSDSGKTERSRSVYKQNREGVLWCLLEERRSTEVCRLSNPRYAAILNRSKSDPAQAILERITQEPHGRFPGSPVSASELFRFGVSPHFCAIGSMPLSRFVVDPSITILRVLKEQDNGHELTRIDYTYSRDDSEEGLQVRVHGSIYLDPSSCWCVRRSKYSSTSTRKGAPSLDSEYEHEFETINHPTGFPLIKSDTVRANLFPYKTKKRELSTSRIEYEWEVNDSVPDNEFTLSAFGLPEPAGMEPVKKPIPLYVWILIAAGACGVIALVFRHLARRRRLAATA